MPRYIVWPLACCAFVALLNVSDAQLRMFRGAPQTAQQPSGSLLGRRQMETRDDQPLTFQGAMPPAPKVPGVTLPPGTKPEEETTALINQAIELTSQRRIDVHKTPPWAIVHSVLALRRDLVLWDQGREVDGIEWMSNQARFWEASDAKNRGAYWFEATQYGARAQPFSGTPYEFEGHANQTLANLAMSNIPLNHQFKIAGGRTVTMADMVRHTQMTANSKEEITWTLWFLTQYLDPDTQWTNAAGERWSMEYLVRLQTQAEVTTAPCGGCHGLFALAYIRNSYLRKHGKLEGIWLSADMKIQQYIEAAKSLQNPDGSFSTMFFKGREQGQNYDDRLKASGHMLEWLMMALPQSRLQEEWVQRGVRALARDLVLTSGQPGNCGFVYHSLNALRMYRQRMEGVQPTKPTVQPELAATGPAKTPLAVAPGTPVTEKIVEAPQTLPTINPPTVAMRPLAPSDLTAETPIERPVPAMPQPTIVEPPAIAAGKPNIQLPPAAPESGMPPLVQPKLTQSPAIVDSTPATPTPNFQPPRVAMLPSEEAPQPRLLTPVPQAPDLAAIPKLAPIEPEGTGQQQAPRAMRVVPGAVPSPAIETPAAPPIKLQRTTRVFIPFSPKKLQGMKEHDSNPVPQDEPAPAAETTPIEAPVVPNEVTPAPASETPVESPTTSDVTQTAAQQPAGPALPAPR